MNKEIISSKQAISLMILFLLGESGIILTGTEARHDVWISTIISIVIASAVVYIYAKFNSFHPESDLFDIIEHCFGKIIGKVFIIIYIWYAFHLASLILINLGELYFSSVGPETPTVVIKIFVVILTTMALKEGIEVLGRFSEIFIIIIIPIILFIAIILIPSMNIDNIRPILPNGIKPVLNGSYSSFSFPFGETIIFTMIFSSLKSHKSAYKVYLTSILISGIILTIVAITIILVVGYEVASTYYYPTLLTLSKISYGDFLERIEILVAFIYVIGGFVKFSMCVLAACKGISKIFDLKNYRTIVIPMLLLMLNLSVFLFAGQIEVFIWISKMLRYYNFPFQVVLPILFFIILKIKKKDNKKVVN